MAEELLKSLMMHYDPEADVLYCSFGDPQDAVGLASEDECIIRRVALGTNELVGFTVIDFLKRFTEHPKETLSVCANRESLEISYDAESDVLYCSMGSPQAAEGIETTVEGVVLRVVPGTNHLIGVTIADFSSRCTEHPEATFSVSGVNAFISN